MKTRRMTAAQAAALSPADVAALTPEALAAMSPAALAALSPEAVAAIDPQTLSRLSAEQLASLSPEARRAIGGGYVWASIPPILPGLIIVLNFDLENIFPGVDSTKPALTMHGGGGHLMHSKF